MAEMFMEKMHAFGNLLQEEWQVFTTPEAHLPKIPLERITLFLFWGAFRVVRVLCLFMLVRGTVMSLETSNKMKALVLGHSLIKRLRRWMCSKS
jgi:hypothetical protein